MQATTTSYRHRVQVTNEENGDVIDRPVPAPVAAVVAELIEHAGAHHALAQSYHRIADDHHAEARRAANLATSARHLASDPVRFGTGWTETAEHHEKRARTLARLGRLARHQALAHEAEVPS